MQESRHILVFRFSALGDVAMTVPVLKNLLLQYSELEVTVVSAPFMEPLFEGIGRLHFYGADTKKEFKGLSGLFRLARKIKTTIPFDAVADLHGVLRTQILRAFLPGKPKAVIDKGRKEKKELTRPANKKLRQLPTSFERYARVFAALGFPVTLNKEQGILKPAPKNLPGIAKKAQDVKWIGVAPFARHAPKMYPLDKMKEVVRSLSAGTGNRIFLFGSRAEAASLKNWEKEFPHVQCIAGELDFSYELNFISQLDMMISMDSANMHLASLMGVPVVSIWGGTHPFLGFYGWGQPYDNALQLDLPCRPSSVFGNKTCPVHGEAGCMQDITPAMVIAKVQSALAIQ